MSTLTGHRPGSVPATAHASRGLTEEATHYTRLTTLLYRRLRLVAGLREIALLGCLWLVYSASRLVANDDLRSARHRAADILDIERFLHLDIESRLNHATAPIMQIAAPMAYWYASLHYIVTPTVLVFLFLRHRSDYPRARNAILISTAIGLTAYMILPTAPPRLMPGGHYIDVLTETARYGWWSDHASAPAGLGHLTNELAAMPSLHVGWSVWVAWALWRHVGAFGRLLSLTYALGTSFVVVATGNHWVLDAVAGATVVAVGIMASGGMEGRAVRRTRQQRASPSPRRRHRAVINGGAHAVRGFAHPARAASCAPSRRDN